MRAVLHVTRVRKLVRICLASEDKIFKMQRKSNSAKHQPHFLSFESHIYSSVVVGTVRKQVI